MSQHGCQMTEVSLARVAWRVTDTESLLLLMHPDHEGTPRFKSHLVVCTRLRCCLPLSFLTRVVQKIKKSKKIQKKSKNQRKSKKIKKLKNQNQKKISKNQRRKRRTNQKNIIMTIKVIITVRIIIIPHSLSFYFKRRSLKSFKKV